MQLCLPHRFLRPAGIFKSLPQCVKIEAELGLDVRGGEDPVRLVGMILIGGRSGIFQQLFHEARAVLHGECLAVGIAEPDPVDFLFGGSWIFVAAGNPQIGPLIIQVCIVVGKRRRIEPVPFGFRQLLHSQKPVVDDVRDQKRKKLLF